MGLFSRHKEPNAGTDGISGTDGTGGSDDPGGTDGVGMSHSDSGAVPDTDSAGEETSSDVARADGPWDSAEAYPQ